MFDTSTRPRAFHSTVALDGGSVRLVRSDLPPIANEDAFAIDVTEAELVSLLADLRSAQLGLDSDRTGGLL